MATLDNTNAGDFVAFERYRSYPPVKCVVVRTTKTRLFVEVESGSNPVAFSRSGYVHGNGSYSTPYIEPWDENVHPRRAKSIKDDRDLQSMRYRLRDFDWRGLDAKQCKAVVAALGNLGFDLKEQGDE